MHKYPFFHLLFLAFIITLLSGTVLASTTIGTNVSTGGTLNVTGVGYFGNNLGIGTSTPYARLSIMNNAINTVPFAIYGVNSQIANLFMLASTTASATSSAFVVNALGMVGIGSSTPYAQLAVAGNVIANYFYADSKNSTSTFKGGLSVASSTSPTFGIYDSSGFRIYANGQVAINKSISTSYFDVNGTIKSNNVSVTPVTVNIVEGNNYQIGTLRTLIGETNPRTISSLGLYTRSIATGFKSATDMSSADQLIVIPIGGSGTTQTYFYYDDGSNQGWLDSLFGLSENTLIYPDDRMYIVRTAGSGSFTWTASAGNISSPSFSSTATSTFNAAVISSRLGIGTTTPLTQLHVTSSSANATSTITIGKLYQNKGSCLELFDASGAAVYAYVKAGGTAFTLSTVSCK